MRTRSAADVGRAAEDHRAAAPAGARAERRRRGVALHDGDVVDVDAEAVGDDLGDRGLQALAVAAAAHQRLHLAVHADADDGGLARHVAHRHARTARRTARGRSRAAGPRARACGLLGRAARRSRSSRPPARASGRSTPGRRPCPLAVVYGRSPSSMTLRRRSSSGSRPSRRATASIICSRTTVSIIHGPRYEHRPHVFVYTAVRRVADPGDLVRAR